MFFRKRYGSKAKEGGVTYLLDVMWGEEQRLQPATVLYSQQEKEEEKGTRFHMSH